MMMIAINPECTLEYRILSILHHHNSCPTNIRPFRTGPML
jgi:hypothetical protein